MKTIVVDASVVAKWFFREELSDECVGLISSSRRMIAPDLILAEVANVVWKRARRQEISLDEAVAMAGDLVRLPIEWQPSETILAEALELAIVTSRTVYDCFYLALAIGHDCPFVTADRRLKNALAASPLGQRIQLVTEIE